jgi:hypothetical protein
MFGVPVSTLAFVVLAALVVAPVLAQAQQPVLISHAYQLTRAPAVKSTGQTYEALASAYVLYEQCGAELSIPDAEKTYLTEKFASVAREYQIAYQDAYMTYVGASPKQALVDDIAASIKQQQQKAVNTTALLVRQRGCKNGHFRKMRKYVDKLHVIETSVPADSNVLAPRAKFSKKN